MMDAKARLKQVQLTLQYAAENRRAEIALLWTRSAFFWAFSTIAIGSYGVAFHSYHRTLALVVACFATISSLCWTLANRSGKYWQEVWEKKVESLERAALARRIFARDTNSTDVDENWFWGAKQYSPSRMAIAVSDLALIMWASVAAATTFSDFCKVITLVRLAILFLTICYGMAILFWGRSGADQFSSPVEAWNQARQAWQERRRRAQ